MNKTAIKYRAVCYFVRNPRSIFMGNFNMGEHILEIMSERVCRSFSKLKPFKQNTHFRLKIIDHNYRNIFGMPFMLPYPLAFETTGE